VRKPGGRCPQCGVEVARHVEAARAREERIERVVAVVGTVLMLLVFASTAGLGLIEGVVGMRARARSSSSSQKKRSVAEAAPARVEPRLRLERGGPRPNQADVLLLPIAEGAVKAVLARLGARLSRALGRRVRDCEFRGRPDEVLTNHGDSTIVLLGLGAAPGVDAFRRAGARGRQEAERARARRVQAWLGDAAKNGDVAGPSRGLRPRGLPFRRYTSTPAAA
jgi:hypothetical protein